MKPTGILETCLYVGDLHEAQRFYERVLGLEVYAKVQDRHVFFRCGDGMLLLFDPDRTGQSPDSGFPAHGATGPGHAAFRMDEADIEAWRAHLGREKVEIEAGHTWPNGGISIYFRDPAGNSLELATSKTWGLEK